MFQYFNDRHPPIPVRPSENKFQTNWKNLDISFLGALCLPSNCTTEDVKKILEIELSGSDLSVGQTIVCKRNLNDRKRLNRMDIIVR